MDILELLFEEIIIPQFVYDIEIKKNARSIIEDKKKVNRSSIFSLSVNKDSVNLWMIF